MHEDWLQAADARRRDARGDRKEVFPSFSPLGQEGIWQLYECELPAGAAGLGGMADRIPYSS
jgi:hypothetical protein